MSFRLVVDKKKGLKEEPEDTGFNYPPIIKVAANFFSWLFHPVFVPVYIIIFIVYVHPYLFAGISPFQKTRTVMMAVMMYTFFPLISVGLLKAVGFIDSLFLKTQRDRIIPLVACGIWYFWIWFVWRNLPEYPAEAITLTFAIWMSASLGLMANIIMKVSLHAIAMGVMVSFLVALALNQGINFGIYISVALIIAGLVCTSRFIVSNHTQKEIYGGFATGILSMLIAQLVT